MTISLSFLKLGVPSPVTSVIVISSNPARMIRQFLTWIPSSGRLYETYVYVVNEPCNGEEDQMLTLNPFVPHPGLLPLVMSFRPAMPTVYKSGFKKPRGRLLVLMRASLSSAMNPANAGDEAEVPPIDTFRPL